MAAGYAFGVVYRWDAQRRRRLLLVMGSIATALFVVLRLVNVYGDPARWSQQNTMAFTVLSFLNPTKYPPSLLFLMMTLGPALLLLAWFESGQRTQQNRLAAAPRTLWAMFRDALVTFGRVPLFFYILQWLTAHLISLFLHLLDGETSRVDV